MANDSHGKRGFTLIDLLLVIIIMGFMGIMVAPHMSSMAAEEKLNGAVNEMVNALDYTGNLAIAYQRPFGLRAQIAGNWFKVYDVQYDTDASAHHDGDPPVDSFGVVLNPFDKSWFQKDFDNPGPYKGVTITAVPAAGGQVHFNPEGHTGENDSSFTLVYAGKQKTITVDSITGKITVN
jgi:type II secretory pathway pseudopilin PulG